MTVVLTWQTLGLDITYALTQSDGTVEQTQVVANGTNGSEGSSESSDTTDNSEGGIESEQAIESEDSTTPSTENATVTSVASSQANSNIAEGTSDTPNDSDENAIMPASENIDANDANGTYNPDADPVEISSSTCSSINASLSYDSEGANPYDGSAILPTDTLYAKVHVVFNSTGKPTLEQPNVSYTLPDTLDVANKSSDTLLDSNNEKAGTWEITGNTVLLKFSEDWLTKHASEVSANFSLHFTLSNKGQGDGDSTSFTFPGTTETVTIPTKDGSVDGSKSAASFNADDNTFTWTIKVSPKTAAHNLVVSDTIGSNLNFVDGSFTFTDANGSELAGATYSTSGQNATFNLGDLSAGDYYIKYSTKVSQSALDALTDGKALSDVENKCSWKWGTTNPQTHTEITANPQSIKYSMVSKSASGANSDITWTVKLNTGSLKADMSGYTFTDTLGEGHHFIEGTKYSVTDADGNEIAQGDVDANSTTLSFKLPTSVGKQSLTVTYHTAMDNTTSLNPVKNTSEVTPDDDRVTGKDEATYTPTDTANYVEKSLVSRSDDGSTANWTSTVKFTSMAADTDASKVQWTDTISRNTWATFTFSDLALKAGDVTLTEGDDYSVSYNDPGTCTVTFKDSATVKALIGKTDVVITYTTTIKSDGGNPIASGQKFTNTSVLNYDSVKKGEASADYSIVSVPKVIKKANGSKWDANYKWSDGTTGAWIISWEAWVNSYGSYHDSILDLGKNDVVLTDTLPEGMEYKANSFKYILEGNDGYNNVWEKQGAEPEISGNTVTFKVSASEAANSNGEWVGKAKFKFDTAVKNDIAAGDSKEYSNSASAQSGEYTFPSGTGKTTIKNDILTKTHTNESGSSDNKGARIKYTITVNPNAIDLVDGDTLTLVDTMSSTLSFISGSLKVVDASNTDITSSCTHSLENKTVDGKETTVLTLGVPDAKKLTITYQCSPIGVIGKDVTVSNSCSLSGMTATEKTDSTSWTIAKSDAGADAVSYGLTVKKVAQNDASKTLEGAKFKLSSVDTATGKKTEVGSETTGSDGIATFGTKEHPLTSGTLYFVEETEAPEGYEISYEGTYVLFYPATATNEAIEEFDKAYEAAQKLGHEPIIGTVSDASATGPGVTFTVYDKLESGKFNLDVSKVIEGTNAPDDIEFTFTATPQEDAPALKSSSVKITGNGTAQFESVNGALTEDMIGKTYNYTIHEKVPTDTEGWIYDTQDVTATVEVVKENDAIKAKVTYSKNNATVDSATFTNTYETSGTPILHVKKAVNNGKLDTKFKDKTFTFGVYKADSSGKKTGTALQQVQATPGKTVYINNIEKYTSEGVHRYVIHEEGTPEEGWTLAGDVLVTVAATDNGKGQLDLTYTYSTHPSGDENAALFDNTYTEPTVATLEAQKKLTGRDMSKAEFSFELINENDGNDRGKVIETKTAPASKDGVPATVSFTSIKYTEAGIYNYTIKEVTGDVAHVEYDDSEYSAKVVVTRDDDTGKLTATVSYPEQLDTTKAPLFENTYTQATGSFTLKAKKTVNGASLKEDESFTFSATATGENSADAPTFENATTGTSGIATFSAASIGEESIGKTFTYIIHEEDNLDETHWTKAEDVTATVTVGERDKDDNIPVTVTYDNQSSDYATFDNTYATSTTATLKVSKAVKGATDAVKNKEFEFALYEKGESEALQTVKTTAGKTVSFPDAIEYTEAGTYKYDIKELGEDGDGWTYAGPTTATVTVTENDDRSLSAKVEYGRASTDGTAALFTNTYGSKNEVVLSAYKTVNGATDIKTDDEFTFALYKADASGKATSDELDRATAKTGSKAVFDAQEITAEGTYHYLIAEIGQSQNGWTLAKDVLVKVVATDKEGKGTLSFDVTYTDVDGTTSRATDDAKSALFNNTYEATGTATPKVSKTVNSKAPATDKTFDFELQAVTKDAPMPKGTGNKATTVGAAVASFGNITYQLSDAGKTYEYQIIETSELGTGWTAASPLKVTITVGKDNGDGTLKKSTIIYGEDEASTSGVMNNLFETGSGTISVEKTVNGGPIADGEKFTFKLLDEGGKQIGSEITATKKNPTVSFDALTFDSVGIYSYTVHETSDLGDNWTNDADFKVTLTVSDVDGKFQVTNVKYSDDTRGYDKDGNYIVKFNNKYDVQSATGEVKVEKTVNGGPIADGEKFTFKLLDADGNKVAGTDEVTATKENPTVSFGELTFDKAGIYSYTVHETSDLGTGWTNDDDFAVTFTVELGADRNLHVTDVAYGERGYEADGSVVAKFDNKYEAPEVPEQPKTPETKEVKKTTVVTTKSVLPKTGDANQSLITMTASLTAAGLALVALGLSKVRRRMQ